MNRQDLQNLAEAYAQISEKKKDDSYLETDMKKRQENNEKARKEMEKVPGQKNPHFEPGRVALTIAFASGSTGLSVAHGLRQREEYHERDTMSAVAWFLWQIPVLEG